MSFDHLRRRCPWSASQTSLRVYVRVAITTMFDSYMSEILYTVLLIQMAVIQQKAMPYTSVLVGSQLRLSKTGQNKQSNHQHYSLSERKSGSVRVKPVTQNSTLGTSKG